MPSLTPQSRSDEVTSDAMSEGITHGLMALIPSGGAVFLAMRNPKFVKVTNVSARTAMVIMPALFMFAYTSEQRLVHRMEEVAKEEQHSHETVKWAEQQHQLQKRQSVQAGKHVSDAESEKQLTELYRRSIEDSGVQIVPGDTLGLHHRVINYVGDNPVKVLASLAIPTAALVFYGRTGKEHLTLSMKLMQTRVIGQFATISLLLGVIGFKELIDRNGHFITEADAEARVRKMAELRQSLQRTLETKQEEQSHFEHEIEEARKKDLTARKTRVKESRRRKSEEGEKSAAKV